MLATTGASDGIHHVMVTVRVPRERLSTVLDCATTSGVRAHSFSCVPFTDGVHDCVLVVFSTSRGVANECLRALKVAGIDYTQPEMDINLVQLALAKDMRPKTTSKSVTVASGAAAVATPYSENPLESSQTQTNSNSNFPSTAASSVLPTSPSLNSEAVQSQSPPPPSAVRKTNFEVFQSTIKARIAVENMLELVHEGAAFSFDFMMLIIVAACLALIGLLTNSSVVIVAAMLVSPMMGPILGFTFGTVVRDRQLIKVGLVSEMLALIMCVVIGFLGALAAAPAAMRQTPWPTSEMHGRGVPSGLYVGAAIAIPSGVGVALSIMGQNTNSLVGVAISASLLPPCVNSGALWAEASLSASYYQDSCLINNYTRSTWETCCADAERLYRNISLKCPEVDFVEFCCINTMWNPNDIAMQGFYSMLLTIVNIVCIWVFAALFFWIKEVAPLPNKSELWSTIVPNARKFNVELNQQNTLNREELEKELMREIEQSKSSLRGRKKPTRILKGGLQFNTPRSFNAGHADLRSGPGNAAWTVPLFQTQKSTRARTTGASYDNFQFIANLFAAAEEEDDEDEDTDFNGDPEPDEESGIKRE